MSSALDHGLLRLRRVEDRRPGPSEACRQPCPDPAREARVVRQDTIQQQVRQHIGTQLRGRARIPGGARSGGRRILRARAAVRAGGCRRRDVLAQQDSQVLDPALRGDRHMGVQQRVQTGRPVGGRLHPHRTVPPRHASAALLGIGHEHGPPGTGDGPQLGGRGVRTRSSSSVTSRHTASTGGGTGCGPVPVDACSISSGHCSTITVAWAAPMRPCSRTTRTSGSIPPRTTASSARRRTVSAGSLRAGPTSAATSTTSWCSASASGPSESGWRTPRAGQLAPPC